MSIKTEQMEIWSDEFGQAYTDRNTLTPEGLQKLYLHNYGVTRSEMNNLFLNELDRSMRILEVGSNVGNQLIALQEMGFNNLYGIELQSYAVERSKALTKNVNIIQGSAFDIPYKDNYFDLVFTSGVLIHLHPKDISTALTEIHRCAKRYIWGFEYYAEKYTEIPYRDHKSLLWKANFSQEYLKLFADIQLVKEKFYPYLESDNVDVMYLLERI